MILKTEKAKEMYFMNSILELTKEKENSSDAEEKVVFFENEKKLISAEEEEFTYTDFKERIKQEVSKFINQSFDNIVVLAGAGASVVVGDKGIDSNYGKTVAMLAENINQKLEEELSFFSLQELATMSKYNIPTTIEEDIFNKEFNLEDFLSNLLTYEQFFAGSTEDNEKFKLSKDKILQIIKEDTSYPFNNDNMRHDTFLKILSQKLKAPHKLTIITTNYDTLFEEAGESLGFTIMDGFTFSAHPFFDSDMFEWNLVKDIPNIKTKQLEYKPNVISLLKLHGSLTWEQSASQKRISRKHKNLVDNPIMIFPSSNKYAQSYEEPYFELFTKFQELLKKPNTLFITTGFSFADNHISKMITGAIKHNHGLAVLISDFNIEQKHDNWKELNKLRENHFRIAFLKATLNKDLIDYLGGQDGNR